MSIRRAHNGFLQRMAASIHMAIISSGNPFVDEFLGGPSGVQRELAALAGLRAHIAANPTGDASHTPGFRELEKYIHGWGDAEKFLACTVGKTCDHFRSAYYKSMCAPD